MAKVSEVFAVGDTVTWDSQAAGSWKTKTGKVVEVFDFKGGRRYSVEVMPPEGSKAKPKMYYPRTSALRRA